MICFDDFITHLREQDRGEHTIGGYRRDLADFVAWFEITNGEEFTPERVTPLDVREYKSYLQSVKGYKPSTVNRRLAGLRAFFRWARRAGMIASDPTNGVRLVRQVRQAPKWLDRSQQYALLRELRNGVQFAEMRTPQAIFRARRDAAIVALMLFAGLRLAEVAHLMTGDVELNERKGKAIVRKGKARKYREVPLNLDARKALEAYLEVRPESDDNHLFLSQKVGAHGRAPLLSPRAIQERVAVYACKAGLDEVTAHALRHTFAHNLVDAGVSLDRVAMLLGHESLDTTARYTQPGERDLEEAVSRVEWG